MYTPHSSDRDSPLSRIRATYIYSIFVLAILFFACIWILYQTYQASPMSAPQRASFCCPEVVRQLARGANFSLNPCTQFFHYTCYTTPKKIEIERLNVLWEKIVTPTFQGTLSNVASRTINACFRSCINHVIQGRHTPTEAVIAIIEVFGVTKVLNVSEIITLIVLLSAEYDVTFELDVSIEVTSSSLPTVRFSPHQNNARDYTDLQLKLFREAVGVIRSKLGLNTSFAEIADLSARLQSVVTTNTSDAFGDINVLSPLASQMAVKDWKHIVSIINIWSESVAVSVRSFHTVRDIIAILTDEDHRAASSVYVLASAAVTIATRAYEVQSFTIGHPHLFFFCQDDVLFKDYLWETAAMMFIRDTLKDVVIRVMFDSIRGAVVQRVASVLPSAAQRLSIMLSRYHLLLQSDLPFIRPPKMEDNYFKNMLALRKYNHERQKQLNRRGLVAARKSRYNHVIDGGNVVYLRFVALVEVQFPSQSDMYILAPVVGIEIADVFWKAVFMVKDWYEHLSAKLLKCCHCPNQHGLSRLTGLKYPYLSLASAGAAVRMPYWHTPAAVHTMRDMSYSQVFYMSFYFNYVCKIVHQRAEMGYPVDDVKADMNDALVTLSDFQVAFHCARSRTVNASCTS